MFVDGWGAGWLAGWLDGGQIDGDGNKLESSWVSACLFVCL